MTKLEAEARRYVADEPFTLAGFTRAEIEIIQHAYLQAFRAGAQWMREQAAQACDRYAKALPHSLDVSAHNLAIVIRALGTEEVRDE